MEALIYDGPWRMRMDDIDEPTVGPGDVLLRVEAVGICGSDVHGYTGESGRRAPGVVMGHETAGIVEQVGANVTHVRPGDRVVAYIIDGCGRCAACASGNDQRCESKRVLGVNAGRWGAMAQWLVLPGKCAMTMDMNVPAVAAALCEPTAIATRAIAQSGIEPGERCVIIGGGAIGMILVMALRDRGIDDVVVVGRNRTKLAFAESLGATAVHSDDAQAVRAPCVIEAVGVEATVQAALRATEPGGTMVAMGNLEKHVAVPLQDLVAREVTMRGTYGFSRGDFAQAVAFVPRHVEALMSLVGGTCGLADAPSMFEQLARRERGAFRMVIEPNGTTTARLRGD